MKISIVSKVLFCALLFLGIVMVYSAISFAAGDPAKGKESFNTICASCHGPDGKGDGPAAAALDPKPRNLGDAAYVSTLTDEHIFKVIKEGGAASGLSAGMPAWGSVLSDDQIWNVIAYIRTDICKCKHEGS